MHPIEHRLKQIADKLTAENKNILFVRNSLKEYLQDIVLYIIYNDPKLKSLIFYGGTCLRKLYGLNRLSEDLDFETTQRVNLDKIASRIKNRFTEDAFTKIEITTQQSKNVNRILLKFPILFELGLAPNESEKLHVKIEINDNFESELETELTPYLKDQYSMVIKHYPIETLMAGKMIACIERSFTKGKTGIDFKGRDFYDLVWYMQKGIRPDEKRLKISNYTVKTAFNKIDEKIENIRSKTLLQDLQNLIENQVFTKTWCDNFLEFYENSSKQYKLLNGKEIHRINTKLTDLNKNENKTSADQKEKRILLRQAGLSTNPESTRLT